MKALENAGMYLLLDIGSGTHSINREKPTYTLSLFNRFQKVIDSFSSYPNLIGLFAGNEVMNQPNTTQSAPYMKAVIRDLKAYMKTKERNIPIGYSSNDDSQIRLAIRDYLMCGENSTKPDFYGVNMYVGSY